MTSVWGELKRRNVVRVGIGYIIVAWLLLQVADVVLNNIEAPAWVFQTVMLLLALGFPLALFFAWAFELTPEGLKKEKDVDRTESITHVTGRKLDFIIIGVLAAALVMFALDKFFWTVNVEPEMTATGASRSIAVLPFVNMSDDPNNEYFADGISEEILNLLANIPELHVTSRSSAFSFKGQNLDVPTMAARLNVAHVLEGSVRKSDNQLRITAQLIEVDTDTHLWSETYDREMKNIFAIQDEIAAAVANALQITLLGKEAKATETSPEAYALYLQARHFGNLGTVDGSNQAETLIKQALEIAPGYAPAWVELGWVYSQQTGLFGLRTYAEGNDLARKAFQQALAVDPQYGRAYAGLANVARNYDHDFVMAAAHLEQALKLNPGDSDILGIVARQHMELGRVDEAINLYRQSVALDPLAGHGSLGIALYYAERLDEASESLRMAVSLNPESVYAQYRLALVLIVQGDAAAALTITKFLRDDGWRLAAMALVQHALDDDKASNAALDEMIERFSADMAFQVAMVYAFRGEIDNAFDWLEQAYENRDSGITEMLIDPLLTNLHDDPRWEPLLDKVGLPHDL